ncbi:uncharacterized protein LOC110456430 isoform X2 [Mizuhopecten yessoensis]|uniref:uncharacterized protein LOC110456430 isoform X2 n=1 Tax=Mizuhopecten yessoensis TaxID=6573 RepID=UPI000B45D897|nr:uncharacterized protein LOC110456430 isoform X2 [Mizuhopecten yessoensis]
MGKYYHWRRKKTSKKRMIPAGKSSIFKNSMQKQLDVPSRKDQPHGPLAKLDVSGRIDQPQWPQQRLDVPSHKDQLPGPRPLMNDPVHLDQHPRLQTRFDDPGSKDRPPGPRVLIDDPGFKDRPRGTRPLIDDPCHKDQPPLRQQRLNNPSHKNRPPGPRLLIDDPDLKGRYPGPLPLMDDPGHKDQPPGPRLLINDPGLIDQPPWLLTRLDTPCHKDQTPGPRVLMDDPGRKDQPSGPRQLMNDPGCKNLPPRSQWHVTGPNNQHPGSLSHPHRFGCQDQSQDLVSWNRLPVRQDQTPASSLQNCVSNNHEGRRLQGPVHHRERNTLSPHEESLMVNDLLLEQPPSLQSHGDYHEPLDRMPLDGDLLNGIFPRLHEENQQVPVDNRYMEYGIVPDLITEPSPFINLNDYERLDPAHLILHQDHQVLHQGRQQRPHHDERRQRHLNEDFDGSTQRGPVIRVGNLRDCRTVYASRVSHGLRDGTVDENYYLDGQMMCVVCRNRPVGVQLHPCGHIVYCRMCVRSQPSCRQCGGLVEDYTNA